jgi:hypothetical protein
MGVGMRLISRDAELRLGDHLLFLPPLSVPVTLYNCSEQALHAFVMP